MTTEISVLDLMENLENNQWMWSYVERWKKLKELLEKQQEANSQKESETTEQLSSMMAVINEKGNWNIVVYWFNKSSGANFHAEEDSVSLSEMASRLRQFADQIEKQ